MGGAFFLLFFYFFDTPFFGFWLGRFGGYVFFSLHHTIFGQASVSISMASGVFETGVGGKSSHDQL